MATGPRIVLMIQVLFWCTGAVLCMLLNPPADEVCWYNLPAGPRRSRTYLNLMMFIEICSNMDRYIACLLAVREDRDHFPGVFQFEMYFPSIEDHFRAGYLFCIEELPQALEKYSFKEQDIYNCEVLLNFTMCLGKEVDEDDWDDMVSDKNKTKLIDISCKKTWFYYNCLRDQYMRCNSSYSILFTYHFARLGPDCLIQMNESNSLILSENCAVTSRSVNEGPSTLYASMSLALAVGLVWCLLAFLSPTQELIAM